MIGKIKGKVEDLYAVEDLCRHCGNYSRKLDKCRIDPAEESMEQINSSNLEWQISFLVECEGFKSKDGIRQVKVMAAADDEDRYW